MKKFFSDTLKYFLHALIFIGLIVVAIKYLNEDELFTALITFNYWYVPFMLALSLSYFALKGWRFVRLTCPLVNHLPHRLIFKAYIAGEAAVVVPGGVAARAGLMNQLNVPLGKGSIPVIFNSMLDQTVLITGALMAALWFEEARTPVFIILGIIGSLGLILLLPPSRRWLLKAGSWFAQRFSFQEEWQSFLKSLPKVMTLQTLGGALAISFLAFSLDVLELNLALKGVGVSLSYPQAALAFFLPTSLGRFSGLPGGVGITEVGMAGLLASIADVDTGAALAAVAIFRVTTIVFLVLVSALVYFFSWNGEKELAKSAL